MSEPVPEDKILSQEKAIVSLIPRRSLGGRFLRGFSLILGGAILRHFQTSAFLKSFKKEEVEVGDIKDITDKALKLRELTLTNKNLVMLYRKGRLRKKDKIIVLPLECARSIEEKGRIKKFLQIRFEVPSEEKKPINLDLNIFNLKRREVWLNELNHIVSSLERK